MDALSKLMEASTKMVDLIKPLKLDDVSAAFLAKTAVEALASKSAALDPVLAVLYRMQTSSEEDEDTKDIDAFVSEVRAGLDLGPVEIEQPIKQRALYETTEKALSRVCRLLVK